MKNYTKPIATTWTGRPSGEHAYLHEKVRLTDLNQPLPKTETRVFTLLGYACDAGVARNQGRPGAAAGPDAIRQMLGRMPNHLEETIHFWDAGNVHCKSGSMENAQACLGENVARLLGHKAFPIVLGGGHDMAYGHFRGIRDHLPTARIGIVNFDAHFDLRSNENGNNSGTPFYQIALDASEAGHPFDYLCLGIRKDANDAQLFKRAESLRVPFVEREDFSMHELTSVQMILLSFMERVDTLYVTIDLDGFSSAFSPGVSAPSPMGFSPDIAWESLKVIIDSGKLCSLDLAELNPTFDIDHQSARLAASLIHAVMHRMASL